MALGDSGMNASIARGSSWEEDEQEGHIAVMVPYMLYREIQWMLNAIGSQAKPDDLIADIIRGYLKRCGRVTASTPRKPQGKEVTN
jgi:hypothetical protein